MDIYTQLEGLPCHRFHLRVVQRPNWNDHPDIKSVMVPFLATTIKTGTPADAILLYPRHD
jgi:hypothetical protein